MSAIARPIAPPAPGRPAATADDDAALLTRIARGDSAAMRAFYERHNDALRAFLRSRCQDEALAEDIVHDTMLLIWNQPPRHGGRSSVRTWLFAIARNKLVDRMRRSAPLSFVDILPDRVSDAPDAQTVVEAAQDAHRLRDAMARLKPAQRVVLRLAYFEDMTCEDIARIEGIPLGTVKTRIHHAKRALMHGLARRG